MEPRRLPVVLACLALASLTAGGCAALDEGDDAQARIGAALSERRQVEPLLERAVLVAVGRAIPVRCWTASQWPRVLEDNQAPIGQVDPVNVLGLAVSDGVTETINLSPRVCGPLSALASHPGLPPPGRASLDLAQALVTVGHEAGHLVAGLDTEAEAECFGAQHVTRVAEALGMTHAEGELVATLYWGEVYPRLDPSYISPDCRDGGTLDLNPWSSTWP